MSATGAVSCPARSKRSRRIFAPLTVSMPIPFAAEIPALLSAGVPISNRYRRSRAAALTLTGVLAFRFDAPGDLFTPQASAPVLAADGKDERPSGSSRFGERASGGEQAAAATGQARLRPLARRTRRMST